MRIIISGVLIALAFLTGLYLGTGRSVAWFVYRVELRRMQSTYDAVEKALTADVEQYQREADQCKARNEEILRVCSNVRTP